MCLPAFLSNRNYVDRGIIAGAGTSIQVRMNLSLSMSIPSLDVYLSPYTFYEVICICACALVV